VIACCSSVFSVYGVVATAMLERSKGRFQAVQGRIPS